ncbi:MAG: hypothetical protein ABIR06_21185 [Cyclobacteriaceae bacterium]
MMKLFKTIGAFTLFLIAFSCEQDVQTGQPLDDSPIFRDLPVAAGGRAANGRASDYKLEVYTAEYITSGESDQVGRIVYFNNVGNKQLGADFVPGFSLDETDNVSYYIDENRPSADISVQKSSAAITRAMNTWDAVNCSQLGITQKPYASSIPTGFVAAILGLSGSFNYVADVLHAGWLPAGFFNAIAPNGSTYILGVTFTIIFTDDAGNPTDIDNNGKLDVAWREIYYNDFFPWADGARFDIETVALHEAGHGLSQGHFGSAFRNSGNNKLHFSPRAVMNAAYSGVQTSIGETDNAGHCSNWASWPQN